MNFLTIFKSKHEKQQELKERILKNREGVLDAFGEAAKGARQCPILLGQKCISGLCEFFLPFQNIDKEEKVFKYHQCTFVKTPLLLIEVREEISKLVSIFRQTAEKEKQENK